MTDLERERERETKRWSEIEREEWRDQIGKGQKNNILLLQNLYKGREGGSETCPEETLQGRREGEDVKKP